MSSSENSLLVPIGVRGMKCLDREKFQREIKVPVLKVTGDKLSKIILICKQYLLKLENFKAVQSLDQPTENKCIRLDPVKVTKWLDILENDRLSLEKLNINEDQFEIRNLQLTYHNFKYDTIFKAVLPENEETLSCFSQIGHIIHLNLKEHLLEYRSLIGQVLIDKIKTCRTVVNKNGIIDNTYRNFNMDVIAGEEDFLVTVKENRCIFQFDFSKVYWNPRLAKEHERIIQLLKPGDILFDVFCGVGPFSIPAAKRKCIVYANDLNPESFKWLNYNAKHNKINLNFKTYCMDGKDFICNTFKNFIIECCKGDEELKNDNKIHITMNLPSMAVEFLKYFKGLISTMDIKDKFNYEIIVHVYCFAIGDNPYSVAKQMVNENMEMDISSNIIDIFDVRSVSPKKEMMRVTFKLTKEIIFYQNHGNEVEEPPNKKICSREIDN
ncbi:unnamed protein product, partial [Brenthis ino]